MLKITFIIIEKRKQDRKAPDESVAAKSKKQKIIISAHLAYTGMEARPAGGLVDSSTALRPAAATWLGKLRR